MLLRNWLTNILKNNQFGRCNGKAGGEKNGKPANFEASARAPKGASSIATGTAVDQPKAYNSSLEMALK